MFQYLKAKPFSCSNYFPLEKSLIHSFFFPASFWLKDHNENNAIRLFCVILAILFFIFPILLLTSTFFLFVGNFSFFKKVWLFNFFVPISIFCFYSKIKLTYLLTYLPFCSPFSSPLNPNTWKCRTKIPIWNSPTYLRPRILRI